MTESHAEVVLIKLGGSLITDKAASHSLRDVVLSNVAHELASVLSSSDTPPMKIVIGHGSGSFGHVVAEEHGFCNSATTKKQVKGASATQDAAAQLHRSVVSALLKVGLAPFSVAPSSCFIAEHGSPLPLTLEPLEKALDLGMIPVVFGDVVMDRVSGACVLSTERVFLGLAGARGVRSCRIQRSIWLGVTDGVYDADGKTIPVLSKKSFRAAQASIGPSDGTDVTGGMRHRVDAALKLADLGVQSIICNGTTPGVLADALVGKPVAGTVVSCSLEEK